jgi:predicted SAM-dependent methyltransferase
MYGLVRAVRSSIEIEDAMPGFGNTYAGSGNNPVPSLHAFAHAKTVEIIAPQARDRLIDKSSTGLPIIDSMPDRNASDIKINIGCGVSGIEGWHNFDNSLTITLSRIPLLTGLLKLPPWPRDVHRYDVRKGLPFKSASVRYIYSSHTFEHFTYAESLGIAKECFRTLQSGGVIRIAVPDLGSIVRDYLADRDPMASHTLISRLMLNHSLQDFVHPGSNHSQMFDARSLANLLREAGFANPAARTFRESDIPEIDRLELEVRRDESLYVEAGK